MGMFEIKAAANDKLMFNLKATNGEVIATSQTYASKRTCVNGINSVKRNAPVAGVEDQTKEGFETVKNPKFEIYKDNGGDFRFRLKATNGQIIAASQGYSAKANCINGIESVKKNADSAITEI